MLMLPISHFTLRENRANARMQCRPRDWSGLACERSANRQERCLSFNRNFQTPPFSCLSALFHDHSQHLQALIGALIEPQVLIAL